MPESLGCNGQRVCADCAKTHRAIAGHLKQMFAAPPVDRVSSVRAKLFNQIFGAAEELADKEERQLLSGGVPASAASAGL